MISANEYFDGNVKSLGYTGPEGSSTLGVMEEGEYEFGTSKHETMTVIEGALVAKLPGSEEWVTYSKGEAFEIDANQKFQVKAVGQTSYLCQYK